MSEQKAPLLTEATPAASSGLDVKAFLKYGSLAFLIVQNSSHVLLLRYSRVCSDVDPVHGPCKEYTTSVAVLFAELFKLVFCLGVLLVMEQGPVGLLSKLKVDIWDRKLDTAKVAVPSLCYTLQNNLQFVAASHLSAALLQLLYQTKTLSTAIFGVTILGKMLRCNQWFALFVLVFGVVTAQSSQSSGSSANKGNVVIGVAAAVGVSVASGFASVYLEKILKGDKTSIWVRNVQLCIFSIPLQCLAIYQRDWDKVTDPSKGGLWGGALLHGFCLSTWLVACMFAFGGLLVAIVIRFADNNLKNLAMAVAILLSCLASMPLFHDFTPNGKFWAGAALVCTSIFLYAWTPQEKQTYAAVSPADRASESK